MKDITYDCPNCGKHWIIWDSSMPAITAERQNDLVEMVRTQYDQIGTCKHCERKDPDVPTTLEMDGVISDKDIKDRFYVMKPCIDCGKYTKQDTRQPDKPCQYCKGEMTIASTYWNSIRTWSTKKVLSLADRKKMRGKK